MNQIVTFHRNGPPRITVNGERISDEALEAAVAEFADAPKPREAAARALVVRTLLRQRAAALGIEADSEDAAVEQLLAREVSLGSVSDEEVRRYFEGNRQKFRSGDLFEAHHILFATNQAADREDAIRKAEGTLFQLKTDPELFERVAKEESACSSGQLGGSLGQLTLGAVVPEFWAALVGFGKVGLVPHLVETRFGHHIIRIDRCALGEALPFEAAEPQIRNYLAERLEQRAYQQYIAELIGQARITGIDLGDQRPQPAGPGLPLE